MIAVDSRLMDKYVARIVRTVRLIAAATLGCPPAMLDIEFEHDGTAVVTGMDGHVRRYRWSVTSSGHVEAVEA